MINSNFSTSSQVLMDLLVSKTKKLTKISSLPVDKPDCDCRGMLNSWGKQAGSGTIFKCPRSEMKGMKKYEVRCKVCGELNAYVYALNEKLDDWCDLHYVFEGRIVKEERQRTALKKVKGKLVPITENYYEYASRWFGCMTINISPKDGELGFECSCGNDTRDFRACAIINSKTMKKRIENLIGRGFGKKDSKFIIKEIK